MLSSIVVLIGSLLLILFSSVLFTNGIERLGQLLKMHQGAVGSILAAVGTAMPETIIPIIAIFIYRDAKAMDIAIGAIAGAPFMLATLGFFVTGAGVIAFTLTHRRSLKIDVDRSFFSRDLLFFIVLYSVAVLTTFAREYHAIRIVIALALAASYAFYVKVTMASEAEELVGHEPLILSLLFKVKANLKWVLVQVIGALVIMIVGAHMFVGGVEHVAEYFGVSALILSILITPVATELPEKCNSILWVRKKKDTLALGNITGAMVFQSSFPVAFGVAFTPWNLGGVTMVSAIIALTMAVFLLCWTKVRKSLNPFVLMVGVLAYAAFCAYIALRAAH